jgi:hypothetical protein
MRAEELEMGAEEPGVSARRVKWRGKELGIRPEELAEASLRAPFAPGDAT